MNHMAKLKLDSTIRQFNAGIRKLQSSLSDLANGNITLKDIDDEVTSLTTSNRELQKELLKKAQLLKEIRVSSEKMKLSSDSLLNHYEQVEMEIKCIIFELSNLIILESDKVIIPGEFASRVSELLDKLLRHELKPQ